jgi:hypothetical protein
MVEYNVTFPEGDAMNPIQAAGHTVLRKKKKKWTPEDMIKFQLKFYMSPKVSIIQFFKDNKDSLAASKIPEKTFGTYWREAGMKALQDSNTPINTAQSIIEHYADKVKKNAKERISTAIESRRFLSEHEESALVHNCLCWGKAGRGVDRDELLQLVNGVINIGLDEREREEATEKVVRDILERHPDLTKLVNAGSLDPLRAKKANVKTRDTVFCKLQAQTRGLYADGKIPWKDYRDIPSNRIYNMDEVGTDTTKHRRKIIADKRNPFSRIFTITPEGDRMRGHITACITTRADGTLSFVVFYFILFYAMLVDCCVG